MAPPIIHTFAVTIPAGTLSTAPLVTPTVFNPLIIDRIEWRFPGGCNGQVGIQLGARKEGVLPNGHQTYFTRSGDTQGYDLSDMHDSGDWSVIGFNTGVFPHTIQVVFRGHRMEPDEPIPGYLVADLVGTLRGGY